MEAAIVFDLDGVLVDTEPLKFRAHRAAVEARGGKLTRERYRRQMGNPHEAVIRAFLEASDLGVSPGELEAYEARFREAYRQLLSTALEPTDGAEALLEACRDQGRALALVTSSDPWMVGIVLPRLLGRASGTDGVGAGGSGTDGSGTDGSGDPTPFRAVVTAADVEREKPAPDPYRKARAALGEAAKTAVAVEDTGAGVASADLAGLPVVAVRHGFNQDHDFERAAAVVEGLAPTGEFLALVDRVAGPAGERAGEG